MKNAQEVTLKLFSVICHTYLLRINLSRRTLREHPKLRGKRKRNRERRKSYECERGNEQSNETK